MTKGKRFIHLFHLLFLLALMLSSCTILEQAAPEPTATSSPTAFPAPTATQSISLAETGATFTLTIVHSNDTWGYVDPCG